MIKWLITILAVLALVAAGLTAQFWVPPLLTFATENEALVEALKTLAEFVAMVLAAVLFVWKKLWRMPERDKVPNLGTTVNIQNATAGSDVIAAGGNVQTGGESLSVQGNVTVEGDLIQHQTIQQSAPPAVDARHQLPPPPGDFVGREEELEELRKAIEKGGATISGLTGQGGVGKTVLALNLAEEIAPQFPDAQIYLDLKGVSEKPLTAGDAMAHVIRAFHPDAKLPDKEDDLKPLYRSVLHEKRALLLMDNARDAGQVRPLIPPKGCALRVTSRQHFALPGLHAKDLNVLPVDKSKELLLEIESRIGGEAKAIAELCGYLPQALRLAGSALAERPDILPTEYVRRLGDEKQRLKLLSPVEASISVSYGLLDAEMQKHWRMLGVFPDTFDTPAAAAVWGLEGEGEGDEAKDTLSKLGQYSMLEWNEATKRYRLHDLMRDFARGRMEKDEGVVSARRHAEHYKDVLALADELYLKGGDSLIQGLALFDLERGNIEVGQAWGATYAADKPEAALLCSSYPNAGAYCLALRQHPHERIRWSEAALAAARRLNSRQDEQVHLGNLGVAYRQLGELHRAIEYFEQHLAIAREIDNKADEGNDLGNLGSGYALLGETSRAIEYYEQALAIDREIGDRRGEGNTLGGLGIAYLQLGESRRAIEYYEQYLAIAREIGDRRGEGNALGNLGVAYKGLGEYRRAIEYHEQTLAIDREIGDRLGEGSSLGNLGTAYALLGETRRAIEYYGQSLTIKREMGDRRGEGNSLWNMGLALDQLGERKKAIEHAEAALKIYEQIEDPNGEKVRRQIEEWGKGQ